ncbi:ATP-dependent zinc metalloprotease FtsH [Bacteroidales bacterium OttesenSCG-928-K03]|nr:ATP-dependent zinc metalloprotease FtsH [Odoribacter sp. OttesenSCG-928-L07]MDL2240150.1 ATP-dependent zinc metalloprotease FtsH [Bacteroidales bacterium OttesenSCG-928-K22]MDL2242974.1 ATP-dependent zinc metalloprotease FtsH [Bacteroidales bacterium OttesenSCG-928-K03]
MDNKETEKRKPDQGLKPNTPQKKKFSFYWIYLAIALVFIGYSLFFYKGETQDTNWRDLSEMLAKGDVSRLVLINKDYVEIYIKQDKVEEYIKDDNLKNNKNFVRKYYDSPMFTFQISDVKQFGEDIREAQVNIPPEDIVYYDSERRKSWGADLFIILGPLLLMIIFFYFMFRGVGKGSGGMGGGQIFNIGKSQARLFDKDTSVSITFKDVAGLEEAKVEIMEVVDFLKHPKKYTDLGGKIPKGVLLVGPPGTGKTLLAKAVAGEAKVPFFSLSGSDFVEMFVGVGASRVRDLFKQAKDKAPCIIFIDEIDAIGRARGKNIATGANDERENTLNQLLTEMDGFGGNNGVIILAATNRADILDRALLRAGRFDRQISVELPDLKEREEIFQVHLRPIKYNDSVKVDFLAKQTPGFSGADIANVCNEAALICARKNKKIVDKQDFLDAIDRIIGGLEKRNKLISPQEKKIIAFHEAGHASVSWLLEHASPLVKVTIVPRGKALGAAWYLPDERSVTSYDQMFDELTTLLAGRASEEINIGYVSTGALNDLERATKMAYAMISYYGLSKKIGNLSYFDSSGQQEYSFNKPYSEKTAEVIDEEVSDLIAEAYERAKQIINENKDKINHLGELLLTREVVFSDDLKDIFGDRKGGSENIPLAKDFEEVEEKGVIEEKPAEEDEK